MQNNRLWNSLCSRRLCLSMLATLMVGSGLSASAASPQAPQGKIYIVVIAVENYKNLQKVPYANADAKAFQLKLKEKLDFYSVKKFNPDGKSGQMLALTTDSDDVDLTPTSDNILELFNKLNFVLKPADTLIVYWAGHGQEYNKQHYLLTMNSNLSNIPLRDSTSVTIQKMKDSLNKVVVHRFLFFIDACRTDPNIKSGDKPNPLSAEFVRGTKTVAQELVQNGEYAILWACQPKQAAWGYSLANHGSFTYFLLQALDKVKPLTMQNLATFVEREVKKWSETRARQAGQEGIFEELQEPWLEAEGSGAIPLGDIVSATSRVTLKVKVNVPDAHVVIDNNPVQNGLYSIDLPNISDGKKRVKVVTSKAGYITDTQNITLEAGDSQELEVNLEVNPNPSVPVKTPHEILAEKGLEMISIPAGPFPMGDDDMKDNPRHTVTLSGYWISKNLITVGQYETFVEDIQKLFKEKKEQIVWREMPEPPEFNPKWSKKDHPIVRVSWDDAMAYCRWLSKKTGLTVTLPTEAQWERAARGTSGLKFPWGDTFDGTKCANSVGSNNLNGTTKVGSYPKGASPDGVLDMAGNVWQWCSDYYSADYITSLSSSNPTGPITGSARVLRGGSWYFNYDVYFRCAFRFRDSPVSWVNSWGFRCAVPADSH